MKDRTKRKPSAFRLVALGATAGGIAGYFLGRRFALRRSMPYLDLWQEALASTWGEVKAAVLAARMESRYQTLLAARPRLTNRALRWHLEMGILPGLALFQVMAEELDDPEKARKVLHDMLVKAMEPLRDLVASMNKFSDPFGAFRTMTKWVVRVAFPPAGWHISMVEDSPKCLAFDVDRCFYQDVLQHYGEGDLTREFCAIDDVVFEALPERIVWRRTGTLGLGDSACDFRWCGGPLDQNTGTSSREQA